MRVGYGGADVSANQDTTGDGDVWTWTAISADTKMMVSYLAGGRTGEAGERFVADVAGRITGRPQLTTDGLTHYVQAMEDAFGGVVDYAVLGKILGADPDEPRRYSPPRCIGTTTTRVCGNPDPEHISTSYSERSHLALRMTNRRFTRLTNAFSKKVENHTYAMAVHVYHYNFCRPHRTLTRNAPVRKPTTPAMAAGMAHRVWTVADLVQMLEVEKVRLEKGGRISRDSRT